MTAPPSRTDIAGTPTRATARAAFGQLWDFVTERLGGGVGSANSTEQDTAAAALGVVRTTQLYGMRNRLINGGFQINQEQRTSAADDVYCLDQWYVLTETGSVTVAQQTDQENGTPYNIRLTQPDATPKRMGAAQILEAANCKDLRARITTLAGRLRCSAATQINYAVLEWTGTADSVTSDVVSSWGGSPTYIASITERAKGTVTPSAATWTDMPALNATINASTNNIIIFVWSNSALAQGTTLDLARMQHEPGAFATPFEHRPITVELALAQRYFWKTYSQTAAPGAITNEGMISLGRTAYTTSQSHSVMAPHPVEMRVPPSVVFYNPSSGATGTWYDGTSAIAMAANAAGTRGCFVYNSGTVTAGTVLFGHLTMNARL